MSDCEHFGKTSEELIADVGLPWIFEHCAKCSREKACHNESKKR